MGVERGRFGVDLGLFGIERARLDADLGLFGIDLGLFGIDLGLLGVDLGLFGIDQELNGVDHVGPEPRKASMHGPMPSFVSESCPMLRFRWPLKAAKVAGREDVGSPAGPLPV
jgi:hypothetical protein